MKGIRSWAIKGKRIRRRNKDKDPRSRLMLLKRKKRSENRIQLYDHKLINEDCF
jgi:anti-sigma factor ChrR (cupin superfamily)